MDSGTLNCLRDLAYPTVYLYMPRGSLGAMTLTRECYKWPRKAYGGILVDLKQSFTELKKWLLETKNKVFGRNRED